MQLPVSDNLPWVVSTSWSRSMARRGLSWVKMWKRSRCRATRMPIDCTVPMDMLWLICCRRTRNIRPLWARRCCVAIPSRSPSAPMSFPRTSSRSTRSTGNLARYVSYCRRSNKCARRCKSRWRHCVTIISAHLTRRPIRWVPWYALHT